MSPYCSTCGHRDNEHGDRALGPGCGYGRMYPNVCGCDDYKEGVTSG